MKSNKGLTLLELISTIGISSLLMIMMVTFFNVWSVNFKKDINYSNEVTSIYEALMYIDYHVNYKGEGCFIRDNKLIIPSENGVSEDYIDINGNELRVYYKNKNTSSYTYQPLLYGTKKFEITQNENVIFIKITTENGVMAEKCVGKR